MKIIITSILLIAFLGQTFNQAFYCLDYAVQQKEYMKRCVNKARPMMHCNGKCQMMKKMEEEAKREQGEAPELKLAAKLDLVSSRSSGLLLFSFSINSRLNYRPYNSASPIDQPSSIFHPPPFLFS